MREVSEAPTRTLSKGLKVLDLLTRSTTDLRLSEVARALSLNVNTAGRLLTTLEAEGFALRQPNGRYRVGPRIKIAAARSLDVIRLSRLARPALVTLRNESGETAFLVTRAGHELIVIDAAESKQQLRVVFESGSIVPLFPAPSGYALVADLALDEVVALAAAVGPERSRFSPDEAASMLAQLRADGYVCGRHPLTEGTFTIATPIWNQGSVAAALALTGPEVRFSEKRAQTYADRLKRLAARLGDALDGA